MLINSLRYLCNFLFTKILNIFLRYHQNSVTYYFAMKILKESGVQHFKNQLLAIATNQTKCAVCRVQYVESRKQCVECTVQCVKCKMQCVEFRVQSAECSVK